jgi:hypothetical protein
MVDLLFGVTSHLYREIYIHTFMHLIGKDRRIINYGVNDQLSDTSIYIADIIFYRENGNNIATIVGLARAMM